MNTFAQQQQSMGGYGGYGGYFNQAPYQQIPAPNNGGCTVFMGGQPVTIKHGVNFAPLQQAIHSSCTDDELAKIRQLGGNVTFDMTDEDILRAKWDFRDGTNLAVELIDPVTQRVRVKYTGEEFNLVMVDDDSIKEFIEIGANITYTTKITNTNLDPVKSQQLYMAWGVVRKLLPIAYKSGKKALSNSLNMAKNQTTPIGYMGNTGINPYMVGGMYGQMPNYVVHDGSTPPQMNINPQYGGGIPPYNYQQVQVADPSMWLQPQPQMMPTGTPMPVGGTALNPFTQGGVPQQMPIQAPPQVGQPIAAPVAPSVPAPGTPTTVPVAPPVGTTPNPTIGGTVNTPTPTATVTAAPF